MGLRIMAIIPYPLKALSHDETGARSVVQSTSSVDVYDGLSAEILGVVPCAVGVSKIFFSFLGGGFESCKLHFELKLATGLSSRSSNASETGMEMHSCCFKFGGCSNKLCVFE